MRTCTWWTVVECLALASTAVVPMAWAHPTPPLSPAPPPEYLAQLQASAAAEPQDYEVALNLANAYRQAGRLQDAEAEARRALELPAPAGDHTAARRSLAEALLESNRPEAAIEQFESAARQATLARQAYHAQVRLAEVFRYYNTGADLSGMYADAFAAFADWDNIGAVTRYAELRAQQAPKSEKSPWLAVSAALRWPGPDRTLTAEVVGIAEAMCAHFGSNADLHKTLCALYRQIGDQASATSAARRAVELQPSAWSAHYLLAQQLGQEAKQDEALVHLGLMIDAAGPWLDVAGEAHRRRAALYAAEQDFSPALDEYGLSMHTLGRDGWSPMQYCWLAISSSRCPEALAFLCAEDASGELDWAAGEGRGELSIPWAFAVLYAATDDREGTVSALDDLGAVLNEENPWLAEVCMELKTASPRAVVVALTGLWLRSAGGDAARATALMEEAVQLAPDLAGPAVILAESLAASDPARAAELARKAQAMATADSRLRARAETVLQRIAEHREGR